MESEKQPQPQREFKLSSIEVKNEVVAYQLIMSALAIAQNRGAFAFDESAKIYECIQLLNKTSDELQKKDK
jgi:hypothetical protein